MSCLRILHRLSCLQTRLSDGFVNPKGFTSRHSKAGQNSMEKRKENIFTWSFKMAFLSFNRFPRLFFSSTEGKACLRTWDGLKVGWIFLSCINCGASVSLCQPFITGCGDYFPNFTNISRPGVSQIKMSDHPEILPSHNVCSSVSSRQGIIFSDKIKWDQWSSCCERWCKLLSKPSSLLSEVVVSVCWCWYPLDK